MYIYRFYTPYISYLYSVDVCKCILYSIYILHIYSNTLGIYSYMKCVYVCVCGCVCERERPYRGIYVEYSVDVCKCILYPIYILHIYIPHSIYILFFYSVDVSKGILYSTYTLHLYILHSIYIIFC